MQHKKLQNKYVNLPLVIGVLGFIAILLPKAVLGADLFFVLPKEPIHQNDEFSIDIALSSSKEAINAVQVDVRVLNDLIEVTSLEIQNSILRFWPKEPSFSNAFGLISFIGGLPTPGFKSEAGLIGKINFKAKQPGELTLTFLESSRVLLNDGLGSAAKLNRETASITILPSDKFYKPKVLPEIKDANPPEPFTPAMSQNDTIFDGKYFVVFETQDDLSGIDYYEVQEIKDDKIGEWIRARSPYVLQNQTGKIKVLVRAVDKLGNKTIGETETTIGLPRLKIYLMILVLIFWILIIIWIIKYIIYVRKTRSK